MGLLYYILVGIALIWTSVWKLMAMWKAAKNNSVGWFISLAIINTLGILPMLYIFVFSKMKKSKSPRKVRASKPVRKKKVVKKKPVRKKSRK